jgi:hypothetical protein
MILDFAGKGQKQAYKKNYFGSGSTANWISGLRRFRLIADHRGKFNFRCKISKSRRSIKVVLGSLEWQLSGPFTVFGVSYCPINDIMTIAAKCQFPSFDQIAMNQPFANQRVDASQRHNNCPTAYWKVIAQAPSAWVSFDADTDAFLCVRWNF